MPLMTTAAVRKLFSASIGAEPLLLAPVILFHGVVQVLTAPHPNALRQLAGSFQIGHCSVGSGVGIQRDLGRSPLVAHRFA
jgi:hypothetical protein